MAEGLNSRGRVGKIRRHVPTTHLSGDTLRPCPQSHLSHTWGTPDREPGFEAASGHAEKGETTAGAR